MKILIVGDLHGQKPKIHYKGFDAIIAPGDFCSDKLKKYMFKALKANLKNPDSRKMWYELIGKQKAKEEVKKSLKDGRKILEYLDSFNVPVYIVPGNWDWTPEKSGWKFLEKNHYATLLKGLKNVVDVYHKKVKIGDYEIIGHGITSGPEFPQYKEDLLRCSRQDLLALRKNFLAQKEKISKLFEKAKKPVIFLSHNVPFNTTIDKINNKESPRNGQHFGSLIARKIIDEHSPLICIGGHMHEHFGKCKVGKTVAVNTGFGSEVNIWLELEGNKIKKLEFHR